VVMSEDGTADDGVLRALRVDQAAEDDKWKKKKAVLRKLTFIYFNNTDRRRVVVGPLHRLVSEANDAAESQVVASPVVDADGDDDGFGADESLSSDDDDLDEYLKDAAELVMSPLANFSNRTEMTCVGNLDETVPVQVDDSQPAQNKAKETLAQKAARKALERQQKEKRRRLNQ